MNIEWYAVTSLKYQAAVQIAAKLLRDLGVIGEIIKLDISPLISKGFSLFSTNVEDNESFHVAIGVHERLVSLSLPELEKHTVSSVLTHMALQLPYWYVQLSKFFETKNFYINLSDVDKGFMLMLVQWNVEGIVNVEATLDKISRHSKYEDRFYNFPFRCMYFFQQTIHYEWKRGNVEKLQSPNDLNAWNVIDYYTCQGEIKNLVDGAFWKEAFNACVLKRDVSGARMCWKKLFLPTRQTIATSLMQNWRCVFEDYIDNILYGEILRLCLSENAEGSLTGFIVTLEPTLWIPALFIRFRFQPERSIVKQLRRMVWTYLPTTSYRFVLSNILQAMNLSLFFMYKHINYYLFVDVWYFSLYKMKVTILEDHVVFLQVLLNPSLLHLRFWQHLGLMFNVFTVQKRCEFFNRNCCTFFIKIFELASEFDDTYLVNIIEKQCMLCGIKSKTQSCVGQYLMDSHNTNLVFKRNVMIIRSLVEWCGMEENSETIVKLNMTNFFLEELEVDTIIKMGADKTIEWIFWCKMTEESIQNLRSRVVERIQNISVQYFWQLVGDEAAGKQLLKWLNLNIGDHV